jgi:hypothetical protein
MKSIRYIPKDSQPVTSDAAPGATVYYYTDRRSAPCAIAYHGKASKHDYHRAYCTEAKRAADTAAYFDGQAKRAQIMAEVKTERAQPHSCKVGDIFHWSWGYDQTNAEFYQVVAMTRATVSVRRIASTQHDTYAWCAGHVVAERDHFIEPPVTKRPGICRGEPYLPMPYGWCSLWDGSPVLETGYA